MDFSLAVLKAQKIFCQMLKEFNTDLNFLCRPCFSTSTVLHLGGESFFLPLLFIQDPSSLSFQESNLGSPPLAVAVTVTKMGKP